MKNKVALLKLCITLFFCLIVLSCKDDEPPANDPNVTPFPFLKVGNEWSYAKTTTTDVEGTITVLEDTTEIIRVDSMIFDELINIRYYMLRSNLPNGDLRGVCHIYDIRDTSLSQDAIKIFYWNCHLGQKWFVRKNGGKNFYAEVVSISEVTETPAGFFDCIKVKISSEDVAKENGEEYLCFWISKKYGIIKSELYGGTPTNNMKATTLLKSKNF